MRKGYILLIFVFAVLVTTIVITRKPSAPKIKLLDRNSTISNSSEWLNTKEAIETLEDNIRRNPDHIDSKLKLALGYMQEARVTGNHGYYDALAFQLINEVLNKDSENFEALSAKATLQATAHQFADALETSNKVIKINPHNAYIYGILCDANVELGNYEEAIKAADKMVSIRPDNRSYSRISYLREIFGDYEGAKAAMTLAMNSGISGFEPTEWARVYLGNLYQLTGDSVKADRLYRQALINRNQYAPALAGLGKLAKERKDYKTGIVFYKKAAKAQDDYFFQQELGELYALNNQNTESQEAFKIAQDMLINHQHPTSAENGIGHNIDRELAQLFITMNEYDLAYNSATAEYIRRPNNIDVNETMAWACYHKKMYPEAQYYVLKAMNTGSKNAALHYKAGLIVQKNNHPLMAQSYFNSAIKINPNIYLKERAPALAEKK